MIADYPGIYLHEMQAKFLSRFGVNVSAAMLCRTLRGMGCSRQVIQHIAIQQSDECRAKFMAEVSMYDPAMLIWIDESGCDRRDSIRKFGYGIRGVPPRSHQLLIHGTRYSVIPIMSTEGIHDISLYEGTVNGSKFEDFIENSLLQPFNGINPFSVVIMDNAAIHHINAVRDLIETQVGAQLLFLPPYSPDLNPLEEVFGQVKMTLFSSPRVHQSLAFNLVNKEDCSCHIAHSGYI